MSLWILGRQGYSLLQKRESRFRMLLVHEEHSHVDVGLRVPVRPGRLPPNGCLERRRRFLWLVQTLIRKTEVVLCFYVAGIELKTGAKCINGLGKTVLVVFGAPEVVPTVRIGGVQGE